jgi:MFS family permease
MRKASEAVPPALPDAPHQPQASAPDRAAAKHDPFAAIRERNYRFFAIAFVASSTGLQMLSTAIGWEIWERTQSELVLGATGLARALPVIALTLPAGTLVDGGDRKKILAATQIGFGLVALALAATSAATAPIWVFFVLLLASGCVRSFNAPARGALLPSLLPMARFENAMAWQSGFFQFAAVLGPLVAGALIAASGGAWVVYLGTAILCTLAGVAALFLKPRPVERTGAPPRLREMFDGAHHIWREKTILGALTLDLLAVLFGGATALLPVYATEILGCGPVGLGALRAAPFVGAFAMAVWLAARPGLRHAGRALLLCVAVFGVCMIVFGLSTSLWLSLAALAVSGAVDNISVVIRHVLVQMRTPDHLRGRTTAVNSVFIECSNELGAFESGLVAFHFGPVVSVVSGGMGTLGVVAFVALAFPALRRMKVLTEPGAPQTKEEMRRKVREAEVEEEEHRRLGPEG